MPKLQCVPCAAHCCNLHFKHIARDIPEFDEVVEECKLVVRRCVGCLIDSNHTYLLECRFSNVDFAGSMLRLTTPAHTGGRQLEVYKPGDTRFASNFRMMDRLCTLRYAITAVALSQPYKERCDERKEGCPVQHLVASKSFWESVEGWRELLWPTYEMLREVDTNRPRMHVVYESALGIQEGYKNSKHPQASKCAEIWAKDWGYLHKPIHSCAHVLDPKYQGDNMQDDNDMWSDFLHVCEKLLGAEAGNLAVQQYSMYGQRAGMFGNSMAQAAAETMEACEWWSAYGSVAPKLKQWKHVSGGQRMGLLPPN